MSFAGPVIRVATQADVDAITEVMRASMLELFPRFYDERQTASASVYVAHVDPALVADGTYFVHDVCGDIVACGGWRRRGRLITDQTDDDIAYLEALQRGRGRAEKLICNAKDTGLSTSHQPTSPSTPPG